MQHHKSLTTHLYTGKNFWENFHGKIISHIDQIVIKIIFSRQFYFEISGTWLGGQTHESQRKYLKC